MRYAAVHAYFGIGVGFFIFFSGGEVGASRFGAWILAFLGF